MANYAIGDIQGCYYSFLNLLAQISFNPAHDQLWLVGDMINRGTGSLEMLRWCHANQANTHVVLGNHDLHALAVLNGIRTPHRSDTLVDIGSAPDRDCLVDWLRHQPLMRLTQHYAIVHAGLLPQWSIAQAKKLAEEVEEKLQSLDYITFLQKMYGNTPALWHDDLAGIERLRVITNAFTRLRVCTQVGEMDFDFKGKTEEIPAGLLPWFEVPPQTKREKQIIFGHWSALGFRQTPAYVALDTGCLWGQQLTAFCLENQHITQVPLDLRDKAQTSLN